MCVCVSEKIETVDYRLYCSDGKKGGGVKPSLVSGEPQVHVQKGVSLPSR